MILAEDAERKIHLAVRNLVEMLALDFDSFIAGLKSAKPSISTVALSRHISSATPAVSSAIIEPIVEEIMTLEYLKQDSEMSPDEFAIAVSDSALAAASESFPFTAQDADVLKVRLTAIFNSDHILELNTKAISVVTDHDKLFLSAKIMTDARPIFNSDGSKLETIALVHMLRLHFEHNNKHEDAFFALDSNDLRNLRRVLDRAEKKAEVLKKAFKESSLSLLDLDQPNVDE